MLHESPPDPKADDDTIAALDYIAVDWGTSNLRVWAMDRDDNVLNSAASKNGMAKLKPDQFERALLDLVEYWLPDNQVTPVIACGMIGAKQGWIEAPYSVVPCEPAQTSTIAPTVDPRISVMILPGVCQLEPADVMRGEETQILGFLRGRRQWSGVICLPGTHSKWVKVENGQVVKFSTFMTGEMFAAFADATVLKHSLGGVAWDDEAFGSSLRLTLAHPDKAPALFFNVRAEGLLNSQENRRARARLSGMLIGLELNATQEFWNGEPVTLLGAPNLSNRYAAALEIFGISCEIEDVDHCTLAGIVQAKSTLASR